MKARDTIDLKNKGKKKKLGGHDDSSVAESQLSLMDIKGNIMWKKPSLVWGQNLAHEY